METYKNEHRWKDAVLWESKLHVPYDYERNGLMKRLLSSNIVNSTNTILTNIILYIEDMMVDLMKSVDTLKNFKNYNWKNR